MAGPYFEGCHPDLERRLEDHFLRVRQSFVRLGRAGSLVLGGGYGRGEGGVMRMNGGVEFSNDLDYFLFDASPDDPELVGWCREIERVESEALGIDVEIKCLRAESIGDPGDSMMFADLVAGHVVVAGDAGFLDRLRDGLDFSRIGAAEATRLLWNRGSGMYFSLCRMGDDSEKKFVIRNHAKLKLALGDAWLCLHGLYDSKSRVRASRLAGANLPDALLSLQTWHAEGLDFKFHPFADGMEWSELESESRRLLTVWEKVYLMSEGIRLNGELRNFASYLELARLVPETQMIKNLTLALRDRLKRGGLIRPIGDYPRGGLMRALPCLLGLTEGGVAEAGRFLPRPAGDPTRPISWQETYSKWWAHYA